MMNMYELIIKFQQATIELQIAQLEAYRHIIQGTLSDDPAVRDAAHDALYELAGKLKEVVVETVTDES